MSGQLGALKIPVPVLANVAVPVGVMEVPGLASVTVAVQVTFPLRKTGFPTHVTTVDVERCTTVRAKLPPLLA